LNRTNGSICFFLISSILLILVFITLYHSTINEYFDDESQLYATPFPIKIIKDQFLTSDWPYFRPLALLQWKLETKFFGKDFHYYHYSLIVLNIINIILILILSFLIFESKPISLLSALIFTLHPAHGEVVTFLWSRFDVDVGIFYMLTLIFFIISYRYPVKEQIDDTKNFFNRRKVFKITSVVTFIFALCSKEMSVTIPIAIFIYIFLKNFHLGIRRSLAISAKESLIPFIILMLFLIFLVIRGSSTNYLSIITSQLPNFITLIIHQIKLMADPDFMIYILLLGLISRDKKYMFVFLFMIISLAPLIHMQAEQRFLFVPSIGYSMCLAWILTSGIGKLYRFFVKLVFVNVQNDTIQKGSLIISYLTISIFILFLWGECIQNREYWHNAQYERNYVPLVIKTGIPIPEGVILYFCDSGEQKNAPSDEIMLSLSGFLFFQYGEKTRALSLIRYFYPKTSHVFNGLDKSIIFEYKDGNFIKRDDILLALENQVSKFGTFSYDLRNIELEQYSRVENPSKSNRVYYFSNLNFPGSRFGKAEVYLKGNIDKNNLPKVKFGFLNNSKFQYDMKPKIDAGNISFKIELYTNYNWILNDEIKEIFIEIEGEDNLEIEKLLLKTPEPIFYDLLKVGLPMMKDVPAPILDLK
jgi:hypothetical protein